MPRQVGRYDRDVRDVALFVDVEARSDAALVDAEADNCSRMDGILALDRSFESPASAVRRRAPR
jgi:hypothetical protein